MLNATLRPPRANASACEQVGRCIMHAFGLGFTKVTMGLCKIQRLGFDIRKSERFVCPKHGCLGARIVYCLKG